MLHEPIVEIGADHASERKTRLGVILFFVYAITYAIFVVLGLVYTELLGQEVIIGLNLAIVYGMGLIILAAIMGLIYNYKCTKMEDEMEGGAKL